MKSSTKIIANIVIGVLIFILFYIYLCAVFVPKDIYDIGGDKYFRGKLFEAETPYSLDVMTFGNSNVYYDLSPMEIYEEYGVTSFSSGAAWQDMKSINKLLNKALKKQQPKVIALDTDCFYTEKSSASFNVLPNVPIESFIAYHTRWKDLKLKDFFTLPDFGAKIDNKKGFYITKQTSNFVPGNYMGDKASEPKKISKKVLKEIDRFVRKCENKGIEVLFTCAPSPLLWNYSKHNAAKELAIKYNIPFLDFNVEITSYTEWKGKFVSQASSHLNYFGAKVLSKQFGEYLAKNYDLKNHRDEEKYMSWEKSLISYKSEVKWAK